MCRHHLIALHVLPQHFAVLLLRALDAMQQLAHLRVTELEDAHVVRAADLLFGADGILAEELVLLHGLLNIHAFGQLPGLLCGLLLLLAAALPGHLATDQGIDGIQVALLGLLDGREDALELRVVGAVGVPAIFVYAELLLGLQVLKERRFFLRPCHHGHHLISHSAPAVFFQCTRFPIPLTRANHDAIIAVYNAEEARIMRISTILTGEKVRLSCEVFPPKKFDGIGQAVSVAREIAALHPSYMSVTYGAAGSTPGHTLALAKAVADAGVTPLCHLTCAQSTKSHVQQVLADMKAAGMENVLALRGDLPKDGAPCEDFRYASELIDFIHAQGDFCVGAACYPEGHPESGSRLKDLEYLKRKVDAGVDFLTTQMFFDNALLYNFLYRALRAGIDVPVCAGIMPICDPKQVARAVQLSGSIMPPRFAAIADRFAHDPAAMAQAGIAFATEQIIDLVANGITNIHLYTMNKPWITRKIVENLSDIVTMG